ncbi:arginine--tRNA ligase 1 [Pullulanibacillus camelliae]|uniref:Arginine--tRNA ligase n=1 Tax=Pullulanibacillus camelliae TaxID=1707096 RepID=A0A8J2YGJ3_9BACL|nr:arginine--tRNA ligase [Pullulanibacillus camelliae]GGE39482.1 arginine--tRNA ligase 1 [Pullulanibacillus camelliae]
MKTYTERYAETLTQKLEPSLSKEAIISLIEVPKHRGHGDLAFPCFQLAKEWKRSPQAIAKTLAVQLNDPLFTSFQAAGPYINAFLNREVVAQETLTEILQKEEDYGAHDFGEGQVIVLDLSSPNIAKPFSMGHLRSTVIGNAIAQLAEKCGFETVRLNYIGDWGTQFGKLIAAYKRWGNEEAVKRAPIAELFKLYTRFHTEAVQLPELEDEGRYWFKELEAGNEEALSLWRWFREESIQAFNAIYSLLGVRFDSLNGEAFYNDKMEPVVTELQEKDLLEESDGARVVRLEASIPPALIKKKDGATLYVTRDLASALYRKQHYHFDYSFYVAGNEQTLHFNQLIQVLKKMGYCWAETMEHIPFGMILKEGKKMSTRQGKVVFLEQVLADIIQQAVQNIREKNPELLDQERVAEQVGVGAVIYHDLKHHRQNDVEFSYDDMLRFEGNTGPYLQYTHARALSILRKSKLSKPVYKEGATVTDQMWELITQLTYFPGHIADAFEWRDPSLLAKSIYKIAQCFNHYYAHTRILVGGDQEQKIALTKATAIVIKEGLRLLGIQAPEEM